MAHWDFWGGGLSLTDQGSILIPHWSGAGENVSVFDNPFTDVVKVPFAANEHVNNYNAGMNILGIYAAAIAGLYASEALNVISPAAVAAAKTGLAFAAGVALASLIGPPTIEAVMDMTENHKNPSQADWQEKQKSKNYSYLNTMGEMVETESYLMETFLYEKPFVNLAVYNENDWSETVDDAKMDSLGLFGATGSLAVISMAETRKQPLKFSSSYDWNNLGVKIERWNKVDGLDSNGNIAPKSVPIRHVERYNVPAITVDNWIEKYSFVVDDLMPHRLRQIKMNFNYQEEIAWECDVSKDSTAYDACVVYKRMSDGKGWSSIDTVKHPVKKSGAFDFIPSDYGYNNLFALQKDNQNTVTISTVNKIGLSNSQRFYYLFKATDDLIEPKWPLPDLVLTQVDGFNVAASTLDYQGFSVAGGEDYVAVDSGVVDSANNLASAMLKEVIPGKGYRLKSTQELDNLSDSVKYVWRYRVITQNAGDKIYSGWENVPFTIDRTPPQILLSTDAATVNPDSSTFVARFKNLDLVPDIRALRFTLEKCNSALDSLCKKVAELPALYDVSNPDFAVTWDSLNKEALSDGLYQIKAFAIDRALPNLEGYNVVNTLVTKIASNTVSVNDWSSLASLNLNKASAKAKFRIDRTAPMFTFKAIEGVLDSTKSIAPLLSGPNKRNDLVYVNQNQLLKLSYNAKETLAGRDSAIVKLLYNFRHIPDTNAVDRAGDSLNIISEMGKDTSWLEMSGLRLSDGDYLVEAIATDEAGNSRRVKHEKRIRVDRTAPVIRSLVSKQLVYPDSVSLFRATLDVSESVDVDSNKTGYSCYYRVSTTKTKSEWQIIKSEMKGRQTLAFNLDTSLVGHAHGKRYLEAACTDVAGNTSYSTDLFHIGKRFPEITSPDSTQDIKNEVIVIRGIAAPMNSASENSTSYRIRYRNADSSAWHTEGIDVGVGRRHSDVSRWISNTSQPIEGNIGFWDRTGLEDMQYLLELGVRSCDVCEYVTDSVLVTLGLIDNDTAKPVLVLQAPQSLVVGEADLALNLRMNGLFFSDYTLRLYAVDSRGTGLFDVSVDHIKANPFYGVPTDTTKPKGVWVYGDEQLWHIVWKGFSESDTVKVRYDSLEFSGNCELLSNCQRINDNIYDSISLDGIQSILDSSFSNFPEIKPLKQAGSVMILTQSGHLVFETQNAFKVELPLNQSLNDYFYSGSHIEPGLAIGGQQVKVSSWTIDRNNYGLRKVWNGLNESGMYPASGYATIYAEAIENIKEGAQVIFYKDSILLKLPPLNVLTKADTLPDYTAIQQATGSDTLWLAKMQVAYGVNGRTAFVSAFILLETGDTIRTLFSEKKQNAGTSGDAYSIIWDGKNESGNAVTASGNYRLLIKAIEAYPESEASAQRVSKSLDFKLSVASGWNLVDIVKENSSETPWFDIREAVGDSSPKSYDPIADYLVKAMLSGHYLPDSLRDTSKVRVKSNISGEQKPLAFEKERFSLGIKRQRDKLDLIMLYKVDRYMEQVKAWGYFNVCDVVNQTSDVFVGESLISFSSSKKVDTIDIGIPSKKEYGFDDDNLHLSKIDLIAVLLKDYYGYLAEKGKKTGELSSKDFDDLKKVAAWKLDYLVDSSGVHIPVPNSTSAEFSIESKTDTGCEANVTFNQDSLKVCEYGMNSDGSILATPDYNPNVNLFDVEMYGKTDRDIFYNNYSRPNSYCKNKRWKEITFVVKLSIPDSYWNAGFGYDNLVNRTIRFDATNKTIYGESNGYLPALKAKVDNKTLTNDETYSYFDGSKWSLAPSYGRVTPFEVQRLSFFSADKLPGSLNTFLFADETPANPNVHSGYKYPSFFTLKFYNDDKENGRSRHFNAKVSGLTDGAAYSGSLTSADDTLRTDLLFHGNVIFDVALNKSFGAQTAVGNQMSIPYPASKENLPQNTDSLRYYAFGSKIHYYYNDYNDLLWFKLFTTSSDSTGFFKNLLNFNTQHPDSTSSGYWDPDSLHPLFLDTARIADKAEASAAIVFEPDHYIAKDTVFYAVINGLNLPKDGGVNITEEQTILEIEPSLYEVRNDTLYVKASSWIDTAVYRRTVQNSELKLPTPTNPIILSMRDLYRYQNGINKRAFNDNHLYFGEAAETNWSQNPWIKGVQIKSPVLLQLNDTAHSHFKASVNQNNDIQISYRDSITKVRPSELVEMVGRFPKDAEYDLAYLKDSVFYPITKVIGTGLNKHLTWFDMNHLQGNTSFLMSWGGKGGGKLNYAQLDLNVGKNIGLNGNTVQSLFGELSVTFPEGALTENKDVTVRTTDASEYNFDVFNNAVLTGPVMEVLPSMQFTDSTALPRIQMKLSKKEIQGAGLSPERVRLYKVDFENELFVPLEHALYGYLNADGQASVALADSVNASCATWDNPKCYNETWAYLLISAETRTFSTFAALDSVQANIPKTEVEVLPQIATSLDRKISITGASDFDLYIDDDALWDDVNDQTPKAELLWTRDSIGEICITLPVRDSSFLFVVAKNDSLTGISAPARALAILLPEEMLCQVPDDSLWLGLDNGYLEFYPNCNQPGNGVLTIYKGLKAIAQTNAGLLDTLRYNGVHQGLKISNGVYRSNYLVNSLIGSEVQYAGPNIKTDSLRPTILNAKVEERSELLDRVFETSFTVLDLESGVAKISLVWVLGQDTLDVTTLIPDSSGFVNSSFHVSRSTISKCLGCALLLQIRVEDFGHNYTNQTLASEKLWPFPAGLALWYPASEGNGNASKEKLGSNHDLDLTTMTSPWLSGTGLYFNRSNDHAAGEGRVDLGTTNAFTIESWVRPGYGSGISERRILGFTSTTGKGFDLLQEGNNLKLVSGLNSWTSLNAISESKVWSHVAVTVDSLEVKFYVDGELLSSYSSLPNFYELYGVFSMGASQQQTFNGHLQDTRLYNRALTSNEVQALFLNLDTKKDTVHTIMVTASDFVYDHFSALDFDCAVPSSQYLVTLNEPATIKMNLFVEKAGVYKIVFYARSTTEKKVSVSMGLTGSALTRGVLDVSTTWRPRLVENISLDLAAGDQVLEIKLPKDIQLAGVAVTDESPVNVAHITWKSSSVSWPQTLKTLVKFEGYPDVSMLRPRIQLHNIGNTTVNGFKVRYYFRGEDPSQVNVSAFYPNDASGLSVHAESGQTGYVEWGFPNEQILPGASPFYGQGPHFGLYNTGYVPWLADDDPSFVHNAAYDFVKDEGIVVLDRNNRPLAGSCVEMEDSISETLKVRVLALDSRAGDAQASQIYLKLENIGNVKLKNYEVRYSFYVEEGLRPIFDVYDMQGLTAEMNSLGSGRYQVSIRGNTSIGPKNSWQNPAQFSLHLSNWESAWNASDDPSHKNLTSEWIETTAVEVFDSLSNRIYGDDPVWPVVVVSETDSTQTDYGYKDFSFSIPVVVTEDGLIISLINYTSLSLDLVNVIGMPVRSIYNGTLPPGDQFIAVNWAGINKSTTYLMVRLSGKIISTQKLSTLGN